MLPSPPGLLYPDPFDAGRLYARRHLEFDLDLALEDPRSFAALWRTSSSSSLTADPDDAQSLHALVAASDRHAAYPAVNPVPPVDRRVTRIRAVG